MVWHETGRKNISTILKWSWTTSTSCRNTVPPFWSKQSALQTAVRLLQVNEILGHCRHVLNTVTSECKLPFMWTLKYIVIRILCDQFSQISAKLASISCCSGKFMYLHLFDSCSYFSSEYIWDWNDRHWGNSKGRVCVCVCAFMAENITCYKTHVMLWLLAM